VRLGIAGATGFVGRALVAALAADHEVLAFARHAPELEGAQGIALDVGDESAAAQALEGCRAAYYLVHSLEADDFRSRDLRLATAFGTAAARAGVERVIYVGGLGSDPSSDHLASRQEVGAALGAAGVQVVELRAAVILGSGSISFEMLRYLTERLPFMVCPRWVRTAIQPVALGDMIDYLVGSLHVTPGVYEVGGAETTTYRDMIAAYARARGLRPRAIVDIPYLTPRLSSYWVDFVTPVDKRVSHSLIESLVTEVVVKDASHTHAAFSIEPLGLDAAIRQALDDQATALERAILDRPSGLADGVYTERVSIDIGSTDPATLDADFDRVGGDLDWYGLPLGWRVRIWAGRVMGERWRLRRPDAVVRGATVDWWRIGARVPGELVLHGDDWFPGDGWLGWRVDEHRLVQVGALRPKGVPGFLYWKLLQPIHRMVFEAQARHRLVRARRRES
jgi:uncharacterized protein YbjT (DUF2867 family)